MVGEELTPDLVEQIGKAATLWARAGRVLVGRDTRSSVPDLEQAVARGIASAGGTAVLGGVLPTPAVALLADDLGVVVSASHNPPEYNGVKLFRGGREARRRARGGDRGALRHPCVRGRSDRVSGRRNGCLSRPYRRALRLGSHGPSDRRRLRERCVLRHRAACLHAPRRGGAHDRSAARRLEHQRRLRSDRPRAAAAARDRGGSRPRGRVRR